MKRAVIAMSVLLVVGLSTGCNRGKDEVLANGTKVFGKRTLKDGTIKAVRAEDPDGRKRFDVTKLPDGTFRTGRVEYPDGVKEFGVTDFPDGTGKGVRMEYPDGEKDFDVTWLPDGTITVRRAEYPNGEKSFDLTWLPDGTQKIGRVERPDGSKQFNLTVLQHLEFRGLRAGQSKAEVEALLKKQDEGITLTCEERSAKVYCEGYGKHMHVKDVSFSADNKLIHFMLAIHGSNSSEGADNPNDFFPALRRELGEANHKEGTFDAVTQAFTWGTERTVVCPLGQEEDCSAEEIRLTDFHICPQSCTAEVEFTDNAYLSEGMVKLDKNRPQPRVTVAMTFMGLEAGEPRSRVDAALQKLHYRPLACEHIDEDGDQACTTRSQSHQFDLGFANGRLLQFVFRYPADEHDELYKTLVRNLGEPTDYTGKERAKKFWWKSKETVRCGVGQCDATTLLLSPSDDGEPNGKLEFMAMVLP